jgi:hypothetical protein
MAGCSRSFESLENVQVLKYEVSLHLVWHTILCGINYFYFCQIRLWFSPITKKILQRFSSGK